MANEIVTLQEAKLYCRVDSDEEDALIITLIRAASDAAIDIASDWMPGAEAPARLKLAVLAHVASAYDNRDSGVDSPDAARRLLFPLRKLDV